MTGVIDHDFVHSFFDSTQFFDVNFDLAGGSLHPGERLVNHDPSVGQGIAFAGRTGGQQYRAHRRRLAHAIGRHVARNELHRVVDRHAGGDAAAGAVDVEMDVRFGIIRLQKQHLGDQSVGDLVVDLLAEKNDSILQQTAVDIVDTFLASALFDNVGNDRHG